MPAEAGAAGIPVEIIPPEPELVPLVAPDRTSSAASAATIAAAAPSPAVVRRPGGDLMPIYSDDDQDVVPARLLTTQTGGPLFRGIQPDMNTMELLISPQGRVEQVRLISPTKRMTDMLLLSGAKTWKFAPALRDGEPVRYRTMFSWEVTR
jgi:hypothetical protein